MSPNELSSALKCFLELTVCQRSAKTTCKQELDFVRSYCYAGPTSNMRTFLESWRINRHYNVKFCAIWRQKKEERKSRIFMSFDVKLNMLNIDRSSFDARGTVEEFSNDSDVCIHFLLLRGFVFLFSSWYSYWYTSLLIWKVVFVWQLKSGLWPRLYQLQHLWRDKTEIRLPRGPKLSTLLKWSLVFHQLKHLLFTGNIII